MKKIDVLVPVFNEGQSIEIFWESRLRPVLNSLKNRYRFTVIFLNNASTDNTLQKLESMKESSKMVEFVTYTRNVGYQNSLLGGLEFCSGDGVVIIDSDGEDPPALISEFLANFEKGFHVVYGDRRNRTEVFWMKKLRKLFYSIMKLAADVEVVKDMAEFSFISNACRKYVLLASRKNSFPFIRAEMARSGLSRKGIPYTRESRIGGRSKYNLLSSFMFAVAAFLTTSTLPLRVLGIIGPILFAGGLIGFILGLIQFVEAVFMLYLVLLGAFISLYLARVYVNQLDRPRFIIDTRKSTMTPIGFEYDL
jgi:dolichol-phosphate mannosyltransferase